MVQSRVGGPIPFSTAQVKFRAELVAPRPGLGARVWDVQSKFRIRVGPLDYATFRDFLPGSKGLRRMHDLVRLYVGQQLDFETQLVLKRDEVPQPDLEWTVCQPGG